MKLLMYSQRITGISCYYFNMDPTFIFDGVSESNFGIYFRMLSIKFYMYETAHISGRHEYEGTNNQTRKI